MWNLLTLCLLACALACDPKERCPDGSVCDKESNGECKVFQEDGTDRYHCRVTGVQKCGFVDGCWEYPETGQGKWFYTCKDCSTCSQEANIQCDTTKVGDEWVCIDHSGNLHCQLTDWVCPASQSCWRYETKLYFTIRTSEGITCTPPEPVRGFCSAGVSTPDSCCALSCGTCGGPGCHERPGGEDSCCETQITDPCVFEDDTACVIPSTGLAKAPPSYVDSGCFTLTDQEACLTSKDGRDGYLDQRCDWCCGETCTSNNNNYCEPHDWLVAQSAFTGFAKNDAGFDTCLVNASSSTPSNVSATPIISSTDAPTLPPTDASSAPTIHPTEASLTLAGHTSYIKHTSMNCFAGSGAGSWERQYPIGTGVTQCQKYCDALPFGTGQGHCSCIVVRDNGECYVKDGVNDEGCVTSQCPDQGVTKDTYTRFFLTEKEDYVFKAQGVPHASGSEYWKEELMGQGVDVCFEGVMEDPLCAKDFFTYVSGGDGNCGCKQKGTLAIRSDPTADYYEIITTRPGYECWTSFGCDDDGVTPCPACGGNDWHCCSATWSYSNNDNCANVQFFSAESSHRCAKAIVTCQEGQGEIGKDIEDASANSQKACRDICMANAACAFFDFTTRPASNSCRLYTTDNTPRLGDGGTHERQYCGRGDVRGFCSAGVSTSGGGYCCAASCGTCGGPGCSERPGGADLCCTRGFTDPCVYEDDTSCLIPTTAQSAIAGSPTAPGTSSPPIESDTTSLLVILASVGVLLVVAGIVYKRREQAAGVHPAAEHVTDKTDKTDKNDKNDKPVGPLDQLSPLEPKKNMVGIKTVKKKRLTMGSNDTFTDEAWKKLMEKTGKLDEAEEFESLPIPTGHKYHAFLTHNWGPDELGRDNHQRVAMINRGLKEYGIVTWFDSEKMEGNIVDQMTEGIDESCIIVAFITMKYIDKVRTKNTHDNCKIEFNYAKSRKPANQIIAVPMDPTCRDTRQWAGAVGAVLGSQLYPAQFTFDFHDAVAFKRSVKSLARDIRDEVQKMEDDWPEPTK